MTERELCAAAVKAMAQAYAPYSGYCVGAALLTKAGKVYTGCNIENASYTPTVCAERTAVFKAVSEGERAFTAIAIASSGSAPWPCGACRQVLNEFAPGIRVLITWDDHVEEKKLSELLPEGFGPKSMQS